MHISWVLTPLLIIIGGMIFTYYEDKTLSEFPFPILGLLITAVGIIIQAVVLGIYFIV